MECEFPRVNSRIRDEIERYLEDTRALLCCCSPKAEKDSNRVAKYLLEVGYDMIPIYPKGDTILGQKVYRNLKDIDREVDMVVVFRKPKVVTDVAKASIERGDVKVCGLKLEL